jgi:hypothetical protein
MIDNSPGKSSAMKKSNRRDFMKGALRMAAGLSAGTATLSRTTSGSSRRANAKGVTAVVPMPVQVVIDDVGWWSGHDGSLQQEPYRTGINRNHVPEDYEAIVHLGQRLGIRPQAAMILCEWDRDNILRTLPTSTWMGSNWDNRKWVGPWLEKAADIIRSNAAHFEMTVHGVGHEYWTDGKFTRAEWADSNGTMRPLDQVEAHLDGYEALLNQNQLGPLPTSFVPTAFLHGFGPTDGHRQSLAEILKRRGVLYINTPFESMYNRAAVRHGVFGFDAGVITIDRGQDLLEWNDIGKTPVGQLHGPTCGMHWPNLLHPEPERNLEVVEGWVRLLQPCHSAMETLLAADSESFRNQLVHHVCTQLTITDDDIRMDFAKVDSLPRLPSRQELALKVRSPQMLSFESDSIRVGSEPPVESEGLYQYTLRLNRIPGYTEARLNYVSRS